MAGDATGQPPGRGRRWLLAWGILLALPVWTPARAAPATRPLRRPLRGAVVDWEQGLVLAEASQPADLSLPGPEVARATAIRRARQRCHQALAKALPALPLSRGRKPGPTAIREALARAQDHSVELDSAGGARVEVAVAFSDLIAEPSSSSEADHDSERVVLVVGTMPLEAAPPVVIGKAVVVARSAVYRLGPSPKGALRARRDRRGRLVLGPGQADAADVQGAGVVIHFRKPSGR